jgi:signal-transduction protein with cAMP-binding, CBS, and nucleotidyltransferase domain
MKNKKIIRVRDVMKIDFGMIDGVATISEAVKVMKEQKTSVLIVNKRHDDDEYGLILAGDIARHVLAKDRSPERVNVYEIMTKPIISINPEMDIRYCSRMFARYNLVRAPVLEKRTVIGTVSPISLVLDGLYNIC